MAHTDPIFKKLKLLKIKDVAHQQMILILHRKICNNIPHGFDQLFRFHPSLRNIRNVKHFEEIFTFKKYKTHTLSWTGPRVKNNVMTSIFPHVQSVPFAKSTIKKLVKNHYINQY